MILSSPCLDQPTIDHLLALEPLVTDYRAFFSLLDWSVLPVRRSTDSARGRPAHPLTAYLKAFLIRIREGLLYTTHLRDFLLKHPLLILECGFHLVADPTALYGFDPDATVPGDVHLRRVLRTFDPCILQALLHATIQDLLAQIPGLGEVVAFDVKHIYAWVQENNPRAYVADRYDKTRIPAGDPDCKLGVKRSSNQVQPDGATKEKKESLWGYGSGVAAATTADYGDVVLAEYTQPFNENDVTYFRPLYQRVVHALQQYPTHLTADAAYDAWYVYEAAARHGGIAAVPLNQHAHPVYQRTADGTPICPHGLTMQPTFQFNHTNGYRTQRFRCPLLVPAPTGEPCEHPQFVKGCGCVKDVNWEQGGKMRVSLDRSSPLYKAIYTQRTSCERINSQAKELGIERPKVRNRHSIANLNTFIYLVINVRVLHRAKSINKGLLQMN